jgi:hypothetical protein
MEVMITVYIWIAVVSPFLRFFSRCGWFLSLLSIQILTFSDHPPTPLYEQMMVQFLVWKPLGSLKYSPTH